MRAYNYPISGGAVFVTGYAAKQVPNPLTGCRNATSRRVVDTVICIIIHITSANTLHLSAVDLPYHCVMTKCDKFQITACYLHPILRDAKDAQSSALRTRWAPVYVHHRQEIPSA